MTNPTWANWPRHPAESAGTYPLRARSAPKLPSFTGWIGDDIKVTVTYEYTPAERPNYNVESPLCGPGCDAEVDVIEVLLDGVDLRDVLADSVIESLEDQAMARVAA
jgi:hypothetical protein